jgi:ABC-type multidrug transport system ATPase subunit
MLEVVEKICSRVVVLYRGRVVANDSVERLRSLMARESLLAWARRRSLRQLPGLAFNEAEERAVQMLGLMP